MMVGIAFKKNFKMAFVVNFAKGNANEPVFNQHALNVWLKIRDVINTYVILIASPTGTVVLDVATLKINSH